jgi:hypothetical protein
MLKGERGLDNTFKPRHRLYHRCEKEDVAGDRLLGPRIRCEGASVNWSKYSKPWDVIFDHPDFGIARFIVFELPRELPKEQPAGTLIEAHSFLPHHEPLELNYSHSEIWPYKGNQRLKRLSSKIVQKEFRTIMSDRSFILRDPKV